MAEKPASSHQIQDGLLSRMELNDHKAGMEGLDRDRINKIILEASKGSRFYENEQKKEQQVTLRINEQQRRLEELTEAQILQGVTEADLLLATIEGSRDLSRSIVHVDMDAFYAAVEMKDKPQLKSVPMAVGGNNMLSTSNYLARRYGVRAAMPGFIAKKLCPQLVIVPTNFDKYTAVSKQVRAVMADYDPNFSPMSLDEAYLDFTKHLQVRQDFDADDRTFTVVLDEAELCKCESKERGVREDTDIRKPKDDCPPDTTATCLRESANDDDKDNCDDLAQDEPPDKPVDLKPIQCSTCGKYIYEERGRKEEFGTLVEEAVREMRARIHWQTKLTASAGIAPNTMLAKVCSDKNKPNGQYYLKPRRGDVIDFISGLDIRKIGGVGKVAERMLRSLGIQKCSDLYEKRGILYHLYSKISFNYFMRITLAISSTTVERDGERKSMSVERTFGEMKDPKEIYQKCLELSVSLSEDLKHENMVGKTVGIKIKTVNFDLKTRARSLTSPTDDADQIYNAACELLRTEIQLLHPKPLRLRLMGVRMSNMSPKESVTEPQQGPLMSLIQKMQTTSKAYPGDHKTSSPSTSPSKTFGKKNQEETVTSGKSLKSRDIKSLIANMPVIPKSKQEDQLHSSPTKTGQGTATGDVVLPSVSSRLRSGKKVKPKMTYSCPVCGKMIGVPDLTAFNNHIDSCLNEGVTGDCGFNQIIEVGGNKDNGTEDSRKHGPFSTKEIQNEAQNYISMVPPETTQRVSKVLDEICPSNGETVQSVNAAISSQSEPDLQPSLTDKLLHSNMTKGHEKDLHSEEVKESITEVAAPKIENSDLSNEENSTDKLDSRYEFIRGHESKPLRIDNDGALSKHETLVKKGAEIKGRSSIFPAKKISKALHSWLNSAKSDDSPAKMSTDNKTPLMKDGDASLPGSIQAAKLQKEVMPPLNSENDTFECKNHKSRHSFFEKRQNYSVSHDDGETKGKLGESNSDIQGSKQTKDNPIKESVHRATPKATSRKSSDNECGEGTSSGCKNDLLICPICGEAQANKNLILFNKHIDLCLGKNSSSTQNASADEVSPGTNSRSNDPGPSQNLANELSRKGDGSKAKNKSVDTVLKDMPSENSGLSSNEHCSFEQPQEKDCLLTCPVCNLTQLWISFKIFNNHVESCLNRSAIKEILSVQSATTSSDQLKRRRPPLSPDKKNAKKKKVGPNIKTIESFFKRN